MTRSLFVLISCILSFFDQKAIAGEVLSGLEAGSIILRDVGGETVYKNITGFEYNIDRSLIEINGLPALLVLSRGNFYFTLLAKGRKIVIDCAYADGRNNYNGARMTAGMCELNIPLDESYVEIAEKLSDSWWASIYSFDTQPILKGDLPISFLLGSIGDYEIYDRYASKGALINSSPQKYIKSPLGCFDFGSAVVFLVFSNGDSLRPKYLDILQSAEPIVFQRLSESDLRKIAINKCL
jgi:hypothetical protein